MFKSALLALKPTPAGDALIGPAVDLAFRHGLELTACTIIDRAVVAPREPVPIGGAALKHDRDEELLTAARRAAQSLANTIAVAAGGRQVIAHAETCEGDTAECLARRVQEHDLLLVGHAAGDDTGNESLLHRILRHSPRPAIVFPKQPAAGDEVVVAYDGSYQAARTLATLAYSGLAAGRAVHVVTCHADALQAEDIALAACRFLARHGIAASPETARAGKSPGEDLLTLASRHSAGLLVMGAFGKSAVREFFLGSVTRHVLRHLPAPVLLDH
jgi:nucleotide-binding universal stress UspA family protein